MLALAAGYANGPDDANDIYQDAIIAAYRSLPDFRSESQFSTWLYRIVVNTALSHRRKLRRVMAQLLSLKGSYEDEEQYCADSQTPESHMLSDELNKQITRALTTLAPRERMAFVLCHQQEFKLREAAEVMSCSVNSVKSYLFRARGKLQKKLKPYQ
jgi:RNA polymerase sigma-70 factor (ECF subfamily)